MTDQVMRDYVGEALASIDDHTVDPGGSPSGKLDAAQKVAFSSSKKELWPTIDAAAYHGTVGDIVRTIEPHTEADPVALLVQVLVFFGSVIGKSAYYQVEADHHHANLFAVMVGQSAKGRKGTSAGRVRSVMEASDDQWINDRMKSGLSSGEGLINEVRDEIKKWDTAKKQFVTDDPGVKDKRLLVVEAEFGNALAVMERPGNTLSPTIRNAWDGVKLATLTKASSLKATGAHVSIIGHITEDELRARINRTEMANGFANRFLFVCVRRSKLLPHGGNLADSEIEQLGQRMKTVVEFAKTVGRVDMTPAARNEWALVYPDLSAEQPGLLGAIAGRAEAQTVRLALIYALLDQKDEIDVVHLRAGLAVWEYCEGSAAWIFGSALGDPVADEILRALQLAGSKGMTRTALRNLFKRHQSKSRIDAALAHLASSGQATVQKTLTSGRPSETWFPSEDE